MLISSPSNQNKFYSSIFCNIYHVPSIVNSYKSVPMLTGEKPEDYIANHMLVQCEQQANSLNALIHVTHIMYNSPHFFDYLSFELTSLDRVYSQLPNICGLLIYDKSHCINICAFDSTTSESQICVYNIYPSFSPVFNNKQSFPIEWNVTFERIVGNESLTYKFDNLQIHAESVYQIASSFLLNNLKG